MRTRGLVWVGSSAFLAVAVASPGPHPAHAEAAKAEDSVQKSFASTVKPLVTKYCADCHTGADAPGGLVLDTLKGQQDVVRDPGKYQKLITYVNSAVMPPKGAGSPTSVERRTISDWFLRALAPDCGLRTVGRVTVRRLNRAEYTNTIRDLLGIRPTVAQDFPSDDVGYGFDNIGDVLSTSTLHAEKYFTAASKIARNAIVSPGSLVRRLDFSSGTTLSGGETFDGDGNIGMFVNGTATRIVSLEHGGSYFIKFSAFGDQAGPDLPHLIVTVNGTALQQFNLRGKREKPIEYEFPVTLGSGENKIGFVFTNDYYDPKFPDAARRDRNLYIQWLEVNGPEEPTTDKSESETRILGAGRVDPDSKAAVESVLKRFASRAYRRPATDDEAERLYNLYSRVKGSGAGFERSMQSCVAAILCNPNFLFRIETSDSKLDSYEIASRLSYFLWSSMPDEKLELAAANGSLAKPEVIRGEVDRMLMNPKSSSLAEEFAAQWLQLRKLDSIVADTKAFPAMTPSLKASVIQEPKLFFMDVVKADRPITDFITAKDTFVNEELAKFYKITSVAGGDVQHVEHVDPARGGITGMASFLMVTSNPTRTSPVKRGRFVLEELLGTPPPAPPPNVGVLAEDAKSVAALTIKERMAAHRKNPACANCHRQMDAIGFSLENYDGVGQWRTKDGAFPIDATGETADGQKLDGPVGLRNLLVSRKEDFVRAFTEKLLTFGLGRGLGPADTCFVDEIVAQSKKDGYRFHSLVKAIATSDVFLKRS